MMRVVSGLRSVVSEASGLWSVVHFCFALCTLLFALCASANAQQPAKVPRIGYLSGSSISANPPWREAFRRGLRELGYEEEKNIFIEWRFAEGKLDRRPGLAIDLVRLKVDVIVAVGLGDTRTATDATTTIPIVTILGGDPGYGFVATLARPGGNVTGLSTLSPELSGKRLEVLKETVPMLSRVAVFTTSTSADYTPVLKELDLAAGPLGVKLQHLDIRSPKDFEIAFQAAVKGRAEAVLVRLPGPIRSMVPSSEHFSGISPSLGTAFIGTCRMARRASRARAARSTVACQRPACSWS